MSSKDDACEPAKKRSRNSDSSRASDETNDGKASVLGSISPSLLESVDNVVKSYNEAKPYKHGIIEEFCIDGFLEQVLDEVKSNSTVKFKESDLFRVYQSIDLGNLKEECPLALKMPSLMQLRRSLYSDRFRSLVEEMTSLEPGTLTEQVDCAANCHTQGCHLLCHDDVIGTRKISYILYLTDPTPTWNDEDGGRLELYESIVEDVRTENNQNGCSKSTGLHERKAPTPFPVKTILPSFNSFAFFAVTPGESFHSVQEVFCDRPRLSIQGWYHAKEVPLNIEEATLSRLKSTGKGEDTEGDFSQFDDHTNIEVAACEASKKENEDVAPKNLSEADRLHLAQYINKTFLEDSCMDTIRKRFEEESSVQLRDFMNDDWISRIKAATTLQDETDGVGRGKPMLDYKLGVNSDWKAVGPSHKQRFLEYVGESNDTDDSGALLQKLKTCLFQCPSFRRFLEMLTSLGEPTGYRGRVRRFRPGLDYTVAHYGILTTTPVLDVTLCFAAGDGKQCRYDEFGELIGSDDDALWESGDAGGFECYIAADEEDEEADDEYKTEDDSELLSVFASNNTLSLVYRDPGTMRFVKYVGSKAPSSRWDLSLEYEVPEDSDEEDMEVGIGEEGDHNDDTLDDAELKKILETSHEKDVER